MLHCLLDYMWCLTWLSGICCEIQRAHLSVRASTPYNETPSTMTLYTIKSSLCTIQWFFYDYNWEPLTSFGKYHSQWRKTITPSSCTRVYFLSMIFMYITTMLYYDLYLNTFVSVPRCWWTYYCRLAMTMYVHGGKREARRSKWGRSLVKIFSR